MHISVTLVEPVVLIVGETVVVANVDVAATSVDVRIVVDVDDDVGIPSRAQLILYI